MVKYISKAISKFVDSGPWAGTDDSKHDNPPPYSVQGRHSLDAVRQPLPHVPHHRPDVIAVMGPTGTGKTTFISKLAAREMEIGHNLSSCTRECEEVPCKVGDRFVILVDTPGFNDTERSDTDILASLADWMKESFEDGLLLSGIIYLYAISDTRMTHSTLQNLRMFRKLCGDSNLGNVILATTKWGITPQLDAYRRERELNSENGFWGTMITAGSRVRRFENSAPSAQTLVEEILDGSQKFMPQIQQEVVEGKKLSETDAGAYLNGEIIALQKKHQKDQEILREEFKRAEQDRDRKMQDALQRERQQLDQKMANEKENQRKLHMDTVQALQERLNQLEGRIPRVERRFWHLRYQCKLCRNGKTEEMGSWTCPKCGFVQVNVEDQN